ncbi:hypothetical protein As57867_002569, partial [Aphanomyces stellatus]
MTADDLDSWVQSLELAVAPPPAPPSSPSKTRPSKALERMSDRMRSFILNTPPTSLSPPPPTIAEKVHEVSDATLVEEMAEKVNVDSTKSSMAADRSRASSSGKPFSHLTSDEQMRYDYFTDQIYFVKGITDICEELRLVEVP